jgi:internalin A
MLTYLISNPGLPRTLAALTLFGSASLALFSAPAASSEPVESFEAWCLRRADAPAETQRTIDSLLALVGTSDCTVAGAYLARQRQLDLSRRSITDLRPLAGLKNLRVPHLDENSIADISPLSGLTQLSYLTLSQNEITDLNPLMDLSQLEYLFLNENSIADVSPLRELPSLTDLFLRGNQITDVTPLMQMPKLQYV